MKITNKQFKLFKDECHKWMDKLELNNWKVYFVLEDLDGSYGNIITAQEGYVATIKMAKDWDMSGVNNINESIKETAKHEVVHLLLGRFSNYAYSRDYDKGDLYEAEEELVRKLTRSL